MITLHIDNSECRIENLPIAHTKELKNILSYTLPTTNQYYTGGFAASKRYLITAKGVFPTGLLYLVEKFIKDKNLIIKRNDIRRAPRRQDGLFSLNLGFDPYPEQTAAADTVLRVSRGIIVAPTGLGKSAVISMIIQNLQVPTLVVVPSLELKKQLTSSLRTWLGADKVGEIADRRPVAVENVDSMSTTLPAKGYDCVILDEFHRSGAATYRTLNKKCWNGIFYRFGLTATPFRSQEHERLLLESVLSKVIYRIEYQTAVDKGYIVPMQAFYIQLPKTPVKGNKNSWPSVYSELVVNNEYRNNVIRELLVKLQTNNLSTLCLIKEIQHGENIIQGTDIPFIKGENKDNRIKLLEFNLREFPVMVGTTGVVGEGVDTKPCEYVIIAGLGKSKNQFMQQVGRGFRIYPDKKACVIILFCDNSHKWTRAHFSAQCKYLLEEYGIQPTKLEI